LKLFAKYNRFNILASIIIFLLGCFAFFFVMHKVLVQQLDRSLTVEQIEVEQYVKEHNNLPEVVNTTDQQVHFTETTTIFPKREITSTQAWDEPDQDYDEIRVLNFGLRASNRYYKVSISKSQKETEELFKAILPIAVGMIALTLLAGFFINRFFLKRIWKPFYNTIEQMDSFHLHAQHFPRLRKTGINEFDAMNNHLNDMVSRVKQEYQSLKEFTGNAAHEMQTPLSIVLNQTELLMQDEAILKSHHAEIATIEEAAQRLSHLNSSLLLLTKIENQLFIMNEQVEWDILIKKRVKELQELITSQGLSVSTKIAPVVNISHRHLADILLGNLLNNAIRYNYNGGAIAIRLNDKYLMIANTSPLPMLDKGKIFTRFYRHPETKTEGSGLGLSIVQQICDVAGYQFVYTYNQNMHSFSIHFSNKEL